MDLRDYIQEVVRQAELDPSRLIRPPEIVTANSATLMHGHQSLNIRLVAIQEEQIQERAEVLCRIERARASQAPRLK